MSWSDERSNVGEGTLGVDELVGDRVVGDRVVGLITCEGVGDVVGVEGSPWRSGAGLFSTESRLSRSVCRSGCIRTEEWNKTGKDRLK